MLYLKKRKIRQNGKYRNGNNNKKIYKNIYFSR